MSPAVERSRAVSLAFALFASALTWPGASPAGAGDPADIRITVGRVAGGLDNPTAIAFAPDGTKRMFVAEQRGTIRVREPGEGFRDRAFLDIQDRVLAGGERGLLGLAFHPDYRRNGRFFVHYTMNDGDVRVSRFRADPPASNRVDPGTERVFLRVEHSTFDNHNGGALQFGGRYLFIALGDGGSGGDPSGNAQDKGSLLGKILRIDVDRRCGDRRYCSPSTNPFDGPTPGRNEIYHWGLRNPWRFSIDRATGYEWIGDVGQDAREEIDRATGAGRNFGWDCREGTLDVSDSYGGAYCDGRDFTGPVAEYALAGSRCAVIGGYVYRGDRYRDLIGGMYFYADFCTGEMWGLDRTASGWKTAIVRDHGANISTFGERRSGELYMADFAGVVWHLRAARR